MQGVRAARPLQTFVYCLLVLRTIRRVDEGGLALYLPVSALLTIVSIEVLIDFIHHMSVDRKLQARMSGQLRFPGLEARALTLIPRGKWLQERTRRHHSRSLSRAVWAAFCVAERPNARALPYRLGHASWAE